MTLVIRLNDALCLIFRRLFWLRVGVATPCRCSDGKVVNLPLTTQMICERTGSNLPGQAAQTFWNPDPHPQFGLDMQPKGCIFRGEMDAVFKALADPSRRKLLDRLHQNNGQTLTGLCAPLDMTRQAATKHLR